MDPLTSNIASCLEQKEWRSLSDLESKIARIETKLGMIEGVQDHQYAQTSIILEQLERIIKEHECKKMRKRSRSYGVSTHLSSPPMAIPPQININNLAVPSLDPNMPFLSIPPPKLIQPSQPNASHILML